MGSVTVGHTGGVFAKPVAPVVMLYDAECGFCARVADWVARMGFGVTAQSLWQADLDRWHIDPARAEREMPVVDGEGHVTWGHQAWATILRTGAWPARLLGAALGSALISPLAQRVYRWVANNRHRMLGGTSACRLEP